MRHCLSTKTGDLLWWAQTSADENRQVNATAIVFGAGQLFVGIKATNSIPTLWSFGLDGDLIWFGGSQDLDLGSQNFPKLDPPGRIITRWFQTGMMAITPDGDVDWITTHPQGINLPLMPGIDSEGVTTPGPLQWPQPVGDQSRWQHPMDRTRFFGPARRPQRSGRRLNQPGPRQRRFQPARLGPGL